MIFLVAKLSSAQSQNFNQIIMCLNNRQVILDANYFGPLVSLEEGCARNLLAIGKPATDELRPFLDDPTRGIVTHCLLTMIWSRPEPRPRFVDRKKGLKIIYNGLTFMSVDSLLFASKTNLVRNKKRWQAFLKTRM